LISALAAWLTVAASSAFAAPDLPAKAVITGIRAQGTNVTVAASIPAGTRRVILQTRSKVDRGAWTPKSVLLPGEGDREVTFSIPSSVAMEVMRVVTDDDASLPLPVDFYRGAREFEPQPSSASVQTTLNYNAGATPGVVFANNADSTAVTTRTVEESDIWKFSGSTLYFFNQQRGLQIIDVATPSQPGLLHTLPLAAYGEQMYVLPTRAQGSEWLALLAQEQCRWDSTEVHLVKADTNAPAIINTLHIPGRVVESRLIGDVLVIASQGWSNRTVLVTNFNTRPNISEGRPEGVPGNVVEQTVSEVFTSITAVDLADPASPQVRTPVTLPLSANAIHATDRLLFVAATSQPWQIFGAAENSGPTNYVHVFDVSDTAGNIALKGSFTTSGRVMDKFKFGLDGDVVSIVSQVDGRWVSNRFQQPSVVLETFSLADLSAPARLAGITLVTNESVFGTRFTPGRAYVVTFRQIDPLWIVDLTNPADPRVRGELHVPGWSTYIEPLGDRLLAMGIEDGRAAVSLFDVADPAAPSLLDKVFLGDGWSWSEANSDEKAFRVFPDRNLALLPWHGRTAGDRWFQGIQLLDFNRDGLTLRGTIDHATAARRATVIGDEVLSISGGELLAADITDRDHPAVSATLDLSSPVDRVFIVGDTLLRIANPRTTAAGDEATPLLVSLSSRATPDDVLASLPLTNHTLLGATLRDGRLHLLQRAEDTFRLEEQLATNTVVSWDYRPPLIRYSTNEVVTPHPVPPVRECTNLVRTIEFPPGPGVPGYITNITITRCREIPRPPVFETNLVVQTYEVWQPPLPVTNTVVTTNQVSVRVPGRSSLSIVGVADGSLSLLGTTTFTNGFETWGSRVEAHWVTNGILAWSRSGGWSGNFWMIADFIMPTTFGPTLMLPRWFGGGGGEVLVFDVSAPEAPALVSTTEFDTDASVDKVFATGGKLFVSLNRSLWGTWRPAIQISPELPANNVSWVSYSLRVLDLTEPSDPVLRDPVALPGPLLGVSHGGDLLYARTNSTATNGAYTTSLLALAYDGVGASLVTAVEFPDHQSPPVLVKADGRLLVSLADAAGGGPRLETWALDNTGTFSSFDQTALPAPVVNLFQFDDFAVGETQDSYVGIDISAPAPAVIGTGTRPCALWLDATVADASAAAGLWIPRGDFGLWRVSFAQP
jgi:hypothetical protein